MKQIRTFASKIALTLAFSLLFVSCSQYDDDSATTELQKTLKSSTGEEIFKSIFFADGALTDQIIALGDISNKVKNLKAEDLEEYRKAESKYINYLRSLDKNYFDNFKTEIASKNINRIDLVLKKAAIDLSNYVKKAHKNINFDKVVKQYNSDVDFSVNKQMGVALVIVITVAIAIALLAAATMAYVKVEIVEKVSSEAVSISQKESSMLKQQFMIDIMNLK